MRIWKCALRITDQQVVIVPRGSKFLTVQIQKGEPQLWFLCNEKEPMTDRIITIYGTGHALPEYPGEYISTFQELGGDLVWHVFEIGGNMEIGDKVEIVRQNIFDLKNRKIRTGVIKNIDDEHVYVRPSWCGWEIELYPNEVKVIGKWKGKNKFRIPLKNITPDQIRSGVITMKVVPKHLRNITQKDIDRWNLHNPTSPPTTMEDFDPEEMVCSLNFLMTLDITLKTGEKISSLRLSRDGYEPVGNFIFIEQYGDEFDQLTMKCSEPLSDIIGSLFDPLWEEHCKKIDKRQEELNKEFPRKSSNEIFIMHMKEEMKTPTVVTKILSEDFWLSTN